MAAKLSLEDNERLLKEYDNTYFGPICRREELIYSQALMFGYWVAMVGQGVEKIKVWIKRENGEDGEIHRYKIEIAQIKKELTMTLSPATAPRYIDTCNLSATNTHYTYYDNLWSTVTEI